MNVYEIASWDIAGVYRGSGQFGEVAGQVQSWVRRSWEVEGALAAPAVWDGGASEAALADLRTWQAIVARVEPAWTGLAEAVRQAAGHYDRAQDAASLALSIAAVNGITVSADGTVSPGAQVDTAGMEPDQAAAALDRAAASAAVQTQMTEALSEARAGNVLVEEAVGQMQTSGVTADTDWAELIMALAVTFGAGPLPRVPTSASPDDVAAWWAGLPYDVQLALVSQRPDLVGGLDGVAAWARDSANRILLEEILAAGPPGPDAADAARAAYAFAISVDEALRAGTATGQPVQLYLFDVENELAAISVGNLDTAADVAVLVPGMGTSVDSSMTEQVERAALMWATADAVAADGDVAVLAWIGYDAPNLIEASLPVNAIYGGPALASTLAGLAVRPGSPPTTTVVAHSYGTLTTRYAAAEDGELAADAVVLVGSPGTNSLTADFDVPDERVYVGVASFDLVAYSEWHGISPASDIYGAACIDAGAPGWFDGHSSYFEPGSEALAEMAVIIRGRYDLVHCGG